MVVFAVHSWSVRGFLFHLPSFLLKKPLGEIAAIFCYHMVVAVLESAVVTGALVLLAAALPPVWLRKGFVYKGFVLVLATAIAAILLQHSFFYGTFAFDVPNTRLLYERVAVGLLLLLGTWLVVQQSAWLQTGILSLAERLSVMLFVYLPIDAIALLVVAARLLT